MMLLRNVGRSTFARRHGTPVARRRGTILLFGTTILLLCSALAPAQGVSDSRLSAHLINNYTNGARQIVAAHPRILKILNTGGGMMAAAREYKNGTTGGTLVLRIYTLRSYSRQEDPAACAQDFWNTVLAPPLNGLSPADRALIDYVEGPNEGDSTPTWGSLQDAQWFNTFWVTLAPLIGNAGFKPCAFSIAVGNPPGDQTYIRQVLDAIVPALRTCKSYNGGWSYHAYTIPYSKDVNQEIWYSLRYRQYYEYFRQKYPDLSSLPLLLTEGGVDGQTAPGGPGWKAYDAARYQDWLAWYDQQIRQDTYVAGCTLFQIGDVSGWFSFDLEEVSGWLAGHIAASVPPSPPAPPTNLTAAGIGNSIRLDWSASAGATGYRVKRSLVNGGPYTTIASPATVSYVDTAITPGVTYYYVVSAVNSSGESPHSVQVSARATGGYAVNAGGTAQEAFAADGYYSGGNTYSTTGTIDTSAVVDPAPHAVYQTERWNTPSFTYTFGGLIAGAAYTVRLHFAEIYFTGPGQRKFNVSINGTQVLTEFDIVAAAGAANKAVVTSFTVVSDAGGQIAIQFQSGSVNNPKVNGIEIRPIAPPAAPTGLSATPGNREIALSWDVSAGAASYNVKRSTVYGGPYAVIAPAVTTTTYLDADVSNGTRY